ncbi:MAG: DNA polymerase III subunit chi [Methylocystis sp.]|nr:DNA polymerase III subunit chi [Methylocystis sp.]
MPEIAFYHHTVRSVDSTLPLLLEKSLARGWRVVVQAAGAERVRMLNDHLWGYKPESFLPHGTKSDGAPETQPIYLTCENDNPNGADVRFLLDGVQIKPFLSGDAAPKARIALMFSDADKEDARAQWAALRDAGMTLAYYQQGNSGGWKMKAREPGT